MYERIHPRSGGSSSRIQVEAEPKKVTSPKTEPKIVKPPEKLKALPSSRAPVLFQSLSSAEQKDIRKGYQKEVSRIINNNNIPVDRLSFFRKIFNRLLPFSNAPLVAFATVLASSPLNENEDYYIKRMKAVGRGAPGRATYTNKKKGGGKIKKNYAKGGGVRPASY